MLEGITELLNVSELMNLETNIMRIGLSDVKNNMNLDIHIQILIINKMGGIIQKPKGKNIWNYCLKIKFRQISKKMGGDQQLLFIIGNRR
jgi:hypothetical protein